VIIVEVDKVSLILFSSINESYIRIKVSVLDIIALIVMKIGGKFISVKKKRF